MQDCEGIPCTIKERLSEAQVLLSRIPAELQSRDQYLNSNVAYREEYESLREKFFDWTREGDEKLGQIDEKINIENAKADLEELKVCSYNLYNSGKIYILIYKILFYLGLFQQ